MAIFMLLYHVKLNIRLPINFILMVFSALCQLPITLGGCITSISSRYLRPEQCTLYTWFRYLAVRCHWHWYLHDVWVVFSLCFPITLITWLWFNAAISCCSF